MRAGRRFVRNEACVNCVHLTFRIGYMASNPSDGFSVEFVGMALMEIATAMEPFLDQAAFVGSLAPWYLLSEGYLSRPLAEGEAPPTIPTGPQATNDLELVIAVDLQEPSQYKEIVNALYGYREVAPNTGRFLRQKQTSKIYVELVPLIEAGSGLPGMPPGIHRDGAEIIFRQSQAIALQGRDFSGMLRSYSLYVARLSAFVLFKSYLFALRKEPRQIIELCYALEFLTDGPIRAADELKPYMSSLWVRDGIKRLRDLFAATDADGPIAYAKEHGVSLPAAVKFRKLAAYNLIKRFLNRCDGIPDDY